MVLAGSVSRKSRDLVENAVLFFDAKRYQDACMVRHAKSCACGDRDLYPAIRSMGS